MGTWTVDHKWVSVDKDGWLYAPLDAALPSRVWRKPHDRHCSADDEPRSSPSSVKGCSASRRVCDFVRVRRLTRTMTVPAPALEWPREVYGIPLQADHQELLHEFHMLNDEEVDECVAATDAQRQCHVINHTNQHLYCAWYSQHSPLVWTFSRFPVSPVLRYAELCFTSLQPSVGENEVLAVAWDRTLLTPVLTSACASRAGVALLEGEANLRGDLHAVLDADSSLESVSHGLRLRIMNNARFQLFTQLESYHRVQEQVLKDAQTSSDFAWWRERDEVRRFADDVVSPAERHLVSLRENSVRAAQRMSFGLRRSTSVRVGVAYSGGGVRALINGLSECPFAALTSCATRYRPATTAVKRT